VKRASAFAIRRGGGLTTWPEETRKNPLALIRPFRALRYTAAAGPLAELVAPPYDVIDEKERARLAALRATNAIHLIRPVGDEPYRAAAELLASWRRSGAIAQDDEPAMLLYAQRFPEHDRVHERWGVLAALKLEPFDAGIVMPHERTLAGPKEDRLRLIRACRTNLSPIFALVDTPLGLARLAETATPLAEFRDGAAVVHRVWRIEDPAAHAALAHRVAAEQVFIADGHHRYEISLAFRDECRRQRGADDELRAYDFVLCFLASTRDEGLVVLPTHRLLADSPPIESLLERWRQVCSVEERDDPALLWRELVSRADAEGAPSLGVLAHDSPRCWLLSAAAGAERELKRLAPELRSLEVSLLHEVVLPEIPNDRFGYTHDEREAIAAVGSGAARLGILLPPPRVGDVLEISRAHLTMPQKSTYFHPKVLTGLAFHALD
jgi:uncharacterized protein (DUF1015 family)